jgi:hypothetical protein
MSTFQVTGNCGVAGASISNQIGGTAISDLNGNYIIPGATIGVVITTTLAGYTFSPTSSTLIFNSASGVNFVATLTAASGAWSPQDCRDSANLPNLTLDENGSKFYTVPAKDSRVSGPPVDSRVSVPVDSRVSKSVNSRTAPPFKS